MAKSIELSRQQWTTLKERLKQDYSPSVILLREKMKQKLGFVERTHRWVEPIKCKHGVKDKQYTVVMLDFYSEKKCTWFIMKYGDYLNE